MQPYLAENDQVCSKIPEDHQFTGGGSAAWAQPLNMTSKYGPSCDPKIMETHNTTQVHVQEITNLNNRLNICRRPGLELAEEGGEFGRTRLVGQIRLIDRISYVSLEVSL